MQSMRQKLSLGTFLYSYTHATQHSAAITINSILSGTRTYKTSNHRHQNDSPVTAIENT